MSTYKIVRKYFKGHPSETLDTGLSLEEAQAHCSDPETSSSTCTTLVGLQRTEDMGPWMDVYYKEDDDDDADE